MKKDKEKFIEELAAISAKGVFHKLCTSVLIQSLDGRPSAPALDEHWTWKATTRVWDHVFPSGGPFCNTGELYTKTPGMFLLPTSSGQELSGAPSSCPVA